MAVARMTKWEYLFFDPNADPNASYIERLNELGKEGWELAGVATYEKLGTGLYWSSAIFKRQRGSR